ncbi:hypothetical protein CLF_103318 [Clonorchis sinensis]|uniref:Endonuclease/exonuclease/phosphatase domain-containing protein n=1 Tax=Clonorchis sinensis TaxID=79923 RepID=G7Y9K0_CLOSI|nr:hypothetical protein CLF_103318 [Clonorchis sinensis]
MPHRPWRGAINLVALLTAYSRADPALRTDDCVRLASVLRAASARHMVPTSSGISKSLFKPQHPVSLAAFNVRTLKQAGQQAALNLALDALDLDVYCVAETIIQNASAVIELTAPAISNRFRFPSFSPHPINNRLLVGPTLRTDNSVHRPSVLQTFVRHPALISSDILKSTFKPRRSVYLADFNIRTLKQAGQQAALALTLDSIGVDVCYVSERRIPDASTG